MKKYIYRFYDDKISSLLHNGKVLALYGPRRVGKTTLIKSFLENFSGKFYFGNGDDSALREILESENINRITSAFKGYDLIVIDEAQRIINVGLGLKILVDNLPECKVIATGSSSFKLSGKIGEPLTGRQKTALLYPLSALELSEEFGRMAINENLENYLIYGSYPEVITAENTEDKKDYLVLLRDSYLFKDILELENIKNSSKLFDLLKLIAFQIGKEVSLNELSNSLEIAKQTVERYLDLLEKTFVIKRVRGFSGNLRKEVTKTSRYFFMDNGIRNAVINNFNNLSTRNDVGLLWENYLFVERIKKQTYKKIYSNNYFWRTYDKKEIDMVEERDGKLFGYEFKWGGKKKTSEKLWLETYENAEFELINKDNYLDFII